MTSGKQPRPHDGFGNVTSFQFHIELSLEIGIVTLVGVCSAVGDERQETRKSSVSRSDCLKLEHSHEISLNRWSGSALVIRKLLTMKLFAFPTLVLLIVLASGATASINVFKRKLAALALTESRDRNDFLQEPQPPCARLYRRTLVVTRTRVARKHRTSATFSPSAACARRNAQPCAPASITTPSATTASTSNWILLTTFYQLVLPFVKTDAHPYMSPI